MQWSKTKETEIKILKSVKANKMAPKNPEWDVMLLEIE